MTPIFWLLHPEKKALSFSLFLIVDNAVVYKIFYFYEKSPKSLYRHPYLLPIKEIYTLLRENGTNQDKTD
jgi:hypothetical protein